MNSQSPNRTAATMLVAAVAVACTAASSWWQFQSHRRHELRLRELSVQVRDAVQSVQGSTQDIKILAGLLTFKSGQPPG